jgi:spermidine synthase
MTQLIVDGTLWMSDTPDEMRDHVDAFYEAFHTGGRILVHGLGLGMIVQAFLRLEQVEHIDVVESDERIIRLIGSHYAEAHPGRVTFHHGDAYTYRFPPGSRWNVVWHDVWPTITSDNWEGMNRLHRRYGGRADWQNSWCRAEVQRLVREDRTANWWQGF